MGSSFKTIFILIFFLSLQTAKGQDTIYLINRSKIGCNVISTEDSVVRYKPWDTIQKKFYTIPKKQISIVIYSTGFVDTFNLIPAEPDSMLATDTNYLKGKWGFQQGYRDGFAEYQDKSAGNISGISGGFAGIIGMIAPIIYSVQDLNPNYIHGGSYSKSTNADYKRGYLQGATAKQRKYAWIGYGIGQGIRTVLLVTIFVALSF